MFADKFARFAGRFLPLLPAVIAGTAAAEAHAAESKPNVIFILCDDMGYGDLGCYGQQLIATPHIDGMAAEGIRFTQAYAGSPVSAPSRATLMTGQHTGHTHVRGNKEYWRGSRTARYGDNTDYALVGQEPYAADHVVLPEVMKEAGYTTGMFGKWAGGYEGSHSTPATRGVDEYFGYLCQFQAHSYFPNFLHRYSPRRGDTDVVRVTLEENIRHGMPGAPDYLERPQYSADLIHREAMEWLASRSAGEPFCGLFTYTLPHAELAQPADSILQSYRALFADDKPFRGEPASYYHSVEHVHAQFAAMITRLDCYVGEILALLSDKGLDDNTIVIFSSDNGPHEEGGADPRFFNRDGLLRGLKRSCHEGGIRVPFIVRWPGKVEGGAVSDRLIAFYDVLPTLMDLAGVGERYPQGISRSPDDRFDGISFAPTLLGLPGQRDHDYLYWEFHETRQAALRCGDWKLLMKDGAYHLYNLADDVHEDRDVAADYPAVTVRLKALMAGARTEPQVPDFAIDFPD